LNCISSILCFHCFIYFLKNFYEILKQGWFFFLHQFKNFLNWWRNYVLKLVDFFTLHCLLQPLFFCTAWFFCSLLRSSLCSAPPAKGKGFLLRKGLCPLTPSGPPQSSAPRCTAKLCFAPPAIRKAEQSVALRKAVHSGLLRQGFAQAWAKPSACFAGGAVRSRCLTLAWAKPRRSACFAGGAVQRQDEVLAEGHSPYPGKWSGGQSTQ
jgi:hypothetical protein